MASEQKVTSALRQLALAVKKKQAEFGQDLKLLTQKKIELTYTMESLKRFNQVSSMQPTIDAITKEVASIQKRQSEVDSVEIEILNQIDEKIKLTLLNLNNSGLDLVEKKRGQDLVERLTNPNVPITSPQLEFSLKEALKYDNYLLAVRGFSGCYCFNFVMKDGS